MGGTLGIFVAAALAVKGLKVAVVEQGVLAEFKAELKQRSPNQAVVCWDTFNLSRRPGRSRQWMAAQGARRRQARQ